MGSGVGCDAGCGEGCGADSDAGCGDAGYDEDLLAFHESDLD